MIFLNMTIEALRKLPRIEKLRLMETLWEELSRPDSEFKSPAWHGKELAETERRLAEGKEELLDWESAKKTLRKRFK
jgi:Putative addiction module component